MNEAEQRIKKAEQKIEDIKLKMLESTLALADKITPYVYKMWRLKCYKQSCFDDYLNEEVISEVKLPEGITKKEFKMLLLRGIKQRERDRLKRIAHKNNN